MSSHSPFFRAPTDHINTGSHKKQYFLAIPLYWALEPGCDILLFVRSLGAGHPLRADGLQVASPTTPPQCRALVMRASGGPKGGLATTVTIPNWTEYGLYKQYNIVWFIQRSYFM